MVCSQNMPSFGRVKKGEGKEESGGGGGGRVSGVKGGRISVSPELKNIQVVDVWIPQKCKCRT